MMTPKTASINTCAINIIPHFDILNFLSIINFMNPFLFQVSTGVSLRGLHFIPSTCCATATVPAPRLPFQVYQTPRFSVFLTWLTSHDLKNFLLSFPSTNSEAIQAVRNFTRFLQMHTGTHCSISFRPEISLILSIISCSSRTGRTSNISSWI